MRILVTGSNGIIGKPLVHHLRSKGHYVFGCDVGHSSDPDYIRADVSNLRQLDRVFRSAEPDAVYHLAAEFGRNNGEDYFEQVWKTNAIGTRNVLDLADMHGAHMIFASSSEVYGEGFGDRPLSESLLDYTQPRLTNEYAISKWTNELQVRNHARRNGSTPTILRFFNAYGPGENYTPYRSVVSLFCHLALTNQPMTVYGNYRRTFMYIDDFIPTLASVCSSKLNHDVYNIGGNDHRSIMELAETVLECTGASRDLLDVRAHEPHNVFSKTSDITRAIEDLEHDPKVTLEEGVKKTVEWMRLAGPLPA